jgi:prefoldin subunit 5
MDEKELQEKIIRLESLKESLEQLTVAFTTLQSTYTKTLSFFNNLDKFESPDSLVSIFPGCFASAKIDSSRFLFQIGDNVYEEVDKAQLKELLAKRLSEMNEQLNIVGEQINRTQEEAAKLEEELARDVQVLKG